MKSIETYWAKINMGLRNGYDGNIQDYNRVKRICRKYCDDVGLGLTITKLDFIYTGGDEPGLEINIINYPRFPSTPEQVREHAETLGGILMEMLEQYRITIVYPDRTIMLENPTKVSENVV